MNRFIEHIFSHRIKYFWGVLAVLILLGTQLRLPQFDGSFESVGIKENTYMADFKTIDSIYQEGHKVFVEIIPKEESLAAVMKNMDEFKSNLKQNFDTVSFRSVLDLSNVFYSNRKRRKIPIQKALKRFAKVKLFKDLISKDEKSFLIVLGVEADTAKVVVDKVTAALAKTNFDAVQEMNVTSPFHIEDTINNVLMHDLVRIVISILIAFLLIMFFAYRSVFSIVYMIVIVLFTLIGSFFTFQMFGQPFNMITLMVLPVVVVLAVADAIHLLSGMGEEQDGMPIREGLKKVYQKYALPSFLTSITTAVAFFSLSFNDTKSVVNLGQITGLSILLSYFLCYLATPFIFEKWYQRSHVNTSFFKVSNFFQKRTKFFSYLLAPLVIIAIILLPKIQFKNDFEIFLPLDSSAKIQHDKVKEHYYAQTAIDLVFTLSDTMGKEKIISSISDGLENIHGVEFVRSGQTNSMVQGRFFVPIDISKFGGYQRRFEREDGLKQRIQIKVTDPNLIPVIEDEVRAVVKEHEVKDLLLTSQALIFSFVNQEVARSLVKSLLLSSVFLILVFYFLTGNWVQSFIGMFVNVVPLSVIFILFVLLDLNINIVTAITAVVCLGLIVDDTIHAFYRKVILKEPLKELGFGMLTTTIVLVVGFGLFAISSIKPIVIFGVISAIVFVITLISDFTLLIYLLDEYDAFRRRRRLKH